MKYIKQIFIIILLLNLYSKARAEDPRERTYHYEILKPSQQEKPLVKGFASDRVKESINRGLCAVPSKDGNSIYLSWRLLENDSENTAFNIYRSVNGKANKLNQKPIISTCDFTDKNPKEKATYYIRTVIKNKEGEVSENLKVSLSDLKNYTSIKLKDNDKVGKLAIADLNGDGYYDYIVRTPHTNVDPGMPGDETGLTYKISAYLHDGTYLWTYDMGEGIEPGIWYSPFIAYDFNGDGKAEIAIKGAGDNYVKNEKGRIVGGDEYIVILDGMTGKIIDRKDWPERTWRYGDVNRQNRNQIGMAFLDGKTPCILAARGTYRLMVVDAWQLNGDKMEKLWRWDGDEENPVVRSMGAHSMVTGDVDGDGRDEILLGSCMINDNGNLLWSSGLGHSDKAYLTTIDPRLEGMQVFMVSEPKKTDGRGVSVVDAKTGELIWSIGDTTYHVGDGMVADIDPTRPGLECFASEDKKGGSDAKYLLSSDGIKLNEDSQDVPQCRNWIWWDSGLTRQTFFGDNNRWGAGSSSNGRKQAIGYWKGEKLETGIVGDILLIGDITGDWREEVITALPGELRIYRTNYPAKDKRVTLMQDPVYRSYILHRSMGYPQAPVPGYYLGE